MAQEAENENEDGNEQEKENENENKDAGAAKPPWGDDFDPERAWRTITNLRQESAEAKKARQELAERLQAIDDAKKSDLEKLEEKATTAEQRAAAAEASSLRLEVALDNAPEGMSIAQVRKLSKRLSGNTKEELEADAEELFSEFAPAGDDGQRPPRRPQERLRSGAAPGSSQEDDDLDPDKLAELVPRRYKL